LANNGGPTMTHNLLVGSPAIDMGNAAAVAGSGGVPLNDQRGATFSRVFNGDAVPGARIDIGAIEYQSLPPATWGDYNADGVANAADYVKWRRTMGNSVTAFTGADGDGDGMVESDDLNVWRSHFGRTAPAAGAGSGSNSPVELATPAAAFAMSPATSNAERVMVVAQSSSLAAERPQDDALIAWLAQPEDDATADRQAFANAIHDGAGHDSHVQSLDVVFSELDDSSLSNSAGLTPLR
jgi:hypothetical protein